MKKLKKLTMTLALLITAVSGAWAQEETLLTTILSTGDNASFKSGSMTFDDKVTVTFSNTVKNYGDAWGWYCDSSESLLTVAGINGNTITSCKFYAGDGTADYTVEGESPSVYLSGSKVYTDDSKSVEIGSHGVTKIEVYGAAAPTGPEVTWDAATKQATFEMPAYDVELMVEYYPGKLSFGGDAIEGGTVEVVGLTGDALPAGFEKDAEGNIYVAQGTTFTVKATPEEGYHFVCWSDDQNNTNPEREITMPADGSDLSLTATFAENEYDITFSEGTNPDPENPEWTAAPNPAKTKQTVTVTYTGSKKVIGVKAEKKAPAPAVLAPALENGATVTVDYNWNNSNHTYFNFTNNNGTYTCSISGDEPSTFGGSLTMSGNTLVFAATNSEEPGKVNVTINFDTTNNTYQITQSGRFYVGFTISVNGTDLTSQLKEVK